MTISVQRLTLFAIFDALEKDLRSLLLDELLPYHNLDSVLTNHELAKISDRHKTFQESQISNDDDSVALVQYLDFLDTVQIINRNKRKIPSLLAKYFVGITPTLEKCAPIRNSVMHGRPLEIDNFSTICAVANKLSTDTDYNWHHVSETLSEIDNDSSYVFGLNFTISDESPSGAYHNLPIPDFDDTGFVGRKNTLVKVIDAISGPFPVISLVGPGGVGKTALALKVAYELLGKENLQFDAIVWISAKANTLTAKEIERIEGAIEDSVGVFTSILAEFEPNSSHNPEDRVIDLLTVFDVLLIIDNLETVLDNKLRRFIQKTPTGSKILLTSRIGIGAGDLSIEVSPLTMPESRTYFRKLVQSYSVSRLQSINAATLDRYIKRLISNPLFLKWFVTAVKSGSMPEKLLADQTDILKFCLENVVEHLDSHSKLICNAYLVVDGPHSLPMLSRLTGMLPDEIEAALLNLITCNIMTMVSLNDLGDTAYQMSELPRAYLRRIHKLSPAEASRINQRHRSVQYTIEQAGRYRGEEIYRFENFQIENRDQAIVASELKKAFAHIRRKEFDSAEELLLLMSALAPGYFEVERVRAYLKFETGDFVLARQAYDVARELRPDYGPLWYWYGGFLLRAYSDPEGALEAFSEAYKLLPSALVERERARVLLYMGRFNETEAILDDLLERKSLSGRHTAILTDLKIQCYCRNIEHQIKSGEFQNAVELLVAARDHGENIPAEVYDKKMADKYSNILPMIETLLTRFEGSTQEGLIEGLKGWASDFAYKGIPRGRIGRINTGTILPVSIPELGTEHFDRDQYYEGMECNGVISRVSENRTYGFIQTELGDNLFFHQSSVVSRGQCLYMTKGVGVKLVLGLNTKGYCATNLRINFSRNLEDIVNTGQAVRAFVVNRRDDSDFGFAIVPEYGELLICKADFLVADELKILKEGDQIELAVTQNEKGFVGTNVAISLK